MDTEIFLPVCDYDLAATLDSGQVFRWQRIGDSWHGVIGKHFVQLTQIENGIRTQTFSPVENWDWLREFLQIETDLAAESRVPFLRHPRRRAENISGRCTDERRRRQLSRFAITSARSMGMSRVVHFVIDETDRTNPSNRRAALRTVRRAAYATANDFSEFITFFSVTTKNRHCR